MRNLSAVLPLCLWIGGCGAPPVDEMPDLATPDLAMPDLIPGPDLAHECNLSLGCPDGKICDPDTLSCRNCVDVTEDLSCAGGACVAGRCVTGACNVNGQCTAPNTCQSNHTCGCATAATCAGLACVGNKCVPCSDDPQCIAQLGAGKLCVNGSCVTGNCRLDGECGGGGNICCANNCTGNDCCGVADVTHCTPLVCNAGGTCVCPAPTAGIVDVNVSTGDDTTGNGSSVCPVKSVKKALALAAADTSLSVNVRIAAGTYSAAASGEVFPLTASRTGVTLTGAAKATTTITGASANPLVSLPSGGVVTGLTLQNSGAGDTLRAAGVFDVQASDIKGGGSNGCVNVLTASTGTLGSAVLVTGGARGVDLAGTLTIRGLVRSNGTGVTVATGGVLQALGADISLNTSHGVLFSDAAVVNGTSLIDSATLNGNGGDGLRVTLNSRVKLRRTQLLSNGGSGLNAVGASVVLNLGAIGDLGANQFNTTANPNTGAGICNQTSATIDATGNTFKMCPPTTNGTCSGGFDISTAVTAGSCTAL